MMKRVDVVIAILLCLALLGAAPRHVPTADYWAGYAGTKTVPPDVAAQALTWVETDVPGSIRIRPYGVKTMMYTNPNRAQPGQPMYGEDENEYAHNCGGTRVRAGAHYAGQVMTNPFSEKLAAMWRHTVARHQLTTRFDAIFNDDAVGAAYALDQPCGYNFDEWLRGEADLQRKLGAPVIYNGLEDYYNQGVAREIVLNASSIGGMMEECYAALHEDHRVGGWKWRVTQETELRMAQAGKYFFCYGRDMTPADQAYESRLYTYASFLLTYDLATSVLWEYYKTPSGGHVMPETQLVATDPVVRSVPHINVLQTAGGAYARRYRACYIAGRSVGPCVAAVNPDESAAHSIDLSGYTRTLTLVGSGVFDGGAIRVDSVRPPSTLAPLQAVIAFK